jgi:hypothetical protein
MAPAPAATQSVLTSPNAARIAGRIAVDVQRMKQTRIDGGDYDDKKDRIKLKVRLTNTDVAATADRFRGQIHVLGESILDRTAMKLLAAQSFDFTLPPRGTHEMTTDEVATAFDTTGLRFGFRYEGWVLQLYDSTGAVVLVKASVPTLAKNAAKISGLTVGKSHDRTTFKVRDVMR